MAEFAGKVVPDHRRRGRHRPRGRPGASSTRAPSVVLKRHPRPPGCSRPRRPSSTPAARAPRSTPATSTGRADAQAARRSRRSSASAASTCSSTAPASSGPSPFLEQTEEHFEEALELDFATHVLGLPGSGCIRWQGARRRRDREHRLDVGCRRDLHDADQRVLGGPGGAPRADEEPRDRARARRASASTRSRWRSSRPRLTSAS